MFQYTSGGYCEGNLEGVQTTRFLSELICRTVGRLPLRFCHMMCKNGQDRFSKNEQDSFLEKPSCL